MTKVCPCRIAAYLLGVRSPSQKSATATAANHREAHAHFLDTLAAVVAPPGSGDGALWQATPGQRGVLCSALCQAVADSWELAKGKAKRNVNQEVVSGALSVPLLESGICPGLFLLVNSHHPWCINRLLPRHLFRSVQVPRQGDGTVSN